jgi:hypothetical protein
MGPQRVGTGLPELISYSDVFRLKDPHLLSLQLQVLLRLDTKHKPELLWDRRRGGKRI